MPTSVWRRLNQGPTRWPIRLALIVLIGLLVYLGITRQQEQNALTVENRSGQPIAQLEVNVGGQVSSFKDVPPGGQVTVPLGPPGTVLSLDGRLRDDTRVRWNGRTEGRLHLIFLPGGDVVIPREKR